MLTTKLEPSVTYIGEVGEPSAFFESSSELATSFAWRNGRPRLKRRRSAAVGVLLELALGLAMLELAPVSRPSLAVRLPYLFFKYLAQELSAAPSLSSPAAPRTGDVSRDFSACVERLRLKAEPSLDDAPYRLR